MLQLDLVEQLDSHAFAPASFLSEVMVENTFKLHGGVYAHLLRSPLTTTFEILNQYPTSSISEQVLHWQPRAPVRRGSGRMKSRYRWLGPSAQQRRRAASGA